MLKAPPHTCVPAYAVRASEVSHSEFQLRF